jgi:hypothetical protein
MARKIFVSYKFGDGDVAALPSVGFLLPTTARSYVNHLATLLDAHDHIYKGEDDGESLAGFKDETIESRLREKIFDSTVTIVLISKNMKDPALSEADQWIPWEISYSLREKTRDGRTSTSNAFLAVVLPDKNGSYEYFVTPTGCSHCSSLNWKTDSLFSILGKNMFNRKQARTITCQTGLCGPIIHSGNDHSYIHPVRWDHFIKEINGYIAHASMINQSIDEYEVLKLIPTL